MARYGERSRYGTVGPPKKKKPSQVDRAATVWAAEQNLKPWEVSTPSGRSPGPVSDVGMETRRGKKPQASEKTRYRAAFGAAVDAPIKVRGKTVSSREYLAETLTTKRRQQHEQTYRPAPQKRDTGFLAALTATPRSVLTHLSGTGETAGRLAGDAALYLPKQLVQHATEAAYEAQQPGRVPGSVRAATAGAALALRVPTEAALGPQIANVLQGKPVTSKAGLAVDLAAAPFLFGKPVRFGRAVAEGLLAAHGAEGSRAAFRKTFDEAMGGPSVFQAVSIRNRALASPERDALHAEIDLHVTDPVLARWTKQQADAHAHLVSMGEKPGPARRETAAKAYTELRGSMKAGAEQPPPSGVVLPPGVEGVPAGIGPVDAGKQLMKGMSQATRLRREQEAQRTLERGVRAKEAARIMAEIPGRAGHEAALDVLKGPLPTLRWDRFENFDENAVEAMIAHIRAHPGLQGPQKTYTRISTEGALLSVVQGNLPRKFEQKLLRDVFGDAADRMFASVPFWKKAKQAGLNLVGVPRTILASFDLSAPLRQGILFGVSHPVMWGRNFKPMVQAFGSPRIYDQVMQEITTRPTFDLMERAGVPFTDLGAQMGKREEAFMSSYAEAIPGLGHVIRASNRAYTAFLNKSRADYFDWLVEQAQKLRPDVDLEGEAGEKMLKDFARVAGNATGRGTVKNDTLNKALPALNQILFAPRLLKSRFDVIANPSYYWHLDPIARVEAWKHLAGLVGAVGGVLALAKLAGAKVETDPRSADWAKVRVGDTRFDIAAGFQQPLRLGAQVATGTIVSSTTGKTIALTPGGGYGKLSKLDILARFGETKLAPPPGVVVNFFRGTDFAGKPFSWKQEAYSRLTPLLAQDAIELYKEGDSTAGGLAAATALYGIGMWGIGAQTYGPREPTTKKSSGSRYGKSGRYGGSGHYGGSSRYGR